MTVKKAQPEQGSSATPDTPADNELRSLHEQKHATINDARLALLRKPFEDNQISALPKPTISAEEYRKLPRAKCNICGGYHATSNTIHLDYVGHAAVTDRLLAVDPQWNWEPVNVDQFGAPALDADGGMWIKLTICGVTRLGYGDAQGKRGNNATKERIGDAIRNAAMRFGVALDLWHKGELKQAEFDEPAEFIASTKPEVKMPAAKHADAPAVPEKAAGQSTEPEQVELAEKGEQLYISKKLSLLKKDDPDALMQAFGITDLDKMTKTQFAQIKEALKGKK